MNDYLRRTEDGTFEEVSEDKLRSDLAGESFEFVTKFIRGADVVAYDGDVEYTLSFNDDSEGYYWIRGAGDEMSFSTSFVQVERSGINSYFLLGADDDVEMTVKFSEGEMNAVEMVLRVLGYGYTGGPLE